MHITIGQTAVDHVERINGERVLQANRRSSLTSEDNRIALRNSRMAQNDLFEEEEEILYGAGIAN